MQTWTCVAAWHDLEEILSDEYGEGNPFLDSTADDRRMVNLSGLKSLHIRVRTKPLASSSLTAS